MLNLDAEVGRAIFFRGQSYKAAKHYWLGTHRAAPPEETLAKITPYLKRIGVTRMADIAGLDRIGIPATNAIRPNSPTLTTASGKGFPAVAAWVSGIMEAIEMYHAENLRLPELRLSYADVARRHKVIPVEQLPLVKHSMFNVNRAERWTLGWDIIQQEEVAVPAILVELKREPWEADAKEIASFQVGTNGLASGNHFLEALCSGLFEVIERDAVACNRVAERHGRQLRKVALDTIESPHLRELLARFHDAKVGVAVFDCTVDTRVPTFMSYIYDQTTRHFGVFRGYGAHLDPVIAMARSLTEAAQGRAIYVGGARDDMFRHHYLNLKKADSESAIAYLEALPAVVDARELTSAAGASFEEDALIVLDRLQAVGLDRVIVFDLTFPGFDVSVVRVIVPGLEGYMFDYYTPGPRARRFSGIDPPL